MTPRISIEIHLGPDDLAEALRHDVRTGLTAADKHLPPKWFYDERGSQLFDDITRLAEYYPTRRETEILEREASSIAARTGADTLLELGSGTSTKTKLLLDALADKGSLRRIVPFDVCEAVLRSAGPELADRYPGTAVHAIVGDFEQHVSMLPTNGSTLIAFLGGTVGNLRPAARAQFLAALANRMRPGDWLLLGTDLVKDPERLVLAYDDPTGVTAEFNRNVLHVVNRELDGDLVPDRFAHVARWNPAEEWMEMYLQADGAQRAHLRTIDLPVTFGAGELLHTEISAKFTRARIETEIAAAGLDLDEILTDAAGDFALSLASKP